MILSHEVDYVSKRISSYTVERNGEAIAVVSIGISIEELTDNWNTERKVKIKTKKSGSDYLTEPDDLTRHMAEWHFYGM